MKEPAYKTVKEFHFPNVTARVTIPDLTAEERAKRMKAIYKAAVNLLKGEAKNVIHR